MDNHCAPKLAKESSMHEVQDQEMRTQFFAARIGHDLINRRVDEVEWSWNVVDAWKQVYQLAECVHALSPIGPGNGDDGKGCGWQNFQISLKLRCLRYLSQNIQFS